MSEIYTRDFGKARRGSTGYTPPPGYVGTLFDSGGMKMHEADVDISDLSREISQREEVEDVIGECVSCERTEPEATLPCMTDESTHHDRGRIEALLRSIRGKFGTEEILLILTLLIVSSDGIGIEALILGLLLMIK